MASEDCIVVYSTCPDAQTAREIGRQLVQERLAACVNILPGMTSIYRWDGEVCEDGEVAMIIKSRRDLVDRLVERGSALHPYDTPAFVALEVVAGAQPYLAWVCAQTEAGAGR